ncbi:MAG: OmpH family outer membrane protein [Planctomycetes bacterium]|nr:OmpH family outer membrane protein [Planctomycetota bacterium]
MMRSSKAVLIILLAAIVLVTVGYNHGRAASSEIAPAKVAVVNINKVLETSKKHAAWQEKMREEETGIRAELERLSKEMELQKLDIETRTPGSSDYLDLMRQYMEKQALLEAKEKFYEQQVTMKVQQWTEQLFQDVHSVVSDVAKRKGIDLVVSKEDLRFPAASIRDLMLTIKTTTVMYNGQGLDITDEVLVALDAGL